MRKMASTVVPRLCKLEKVSPGLIVYGCTRGQGVGRAQADRFSARKSAALPAGCWLIPG